MYLGNIHKKKMGALVKILSIDRNAGANASNTIGLKHKNTGNYEEVFCFIFHGACSLDGLDEILFLAQ